MTRLSPQYLGGTLLVMCALVVFASPLASQASIPPVSLQPVADILDSGYRSSRMVIINEAHDGFRRSVRTRLVGQLLLPHAHSLGVRYLAAEALTPDLAQRANETRVLPVGRGYLEQPDMRDFLQGALDIGWTLLAYEPVNLEENSTDPMESINWRDDQQARNLTVAIRALPPDARVLVWCGDSHLLQVAVPGSKGMPYRPMGLRFRELSGVDPFVIDQTVSVDFDGTGARASRWLAVFRNQLEASPNIALGFLDSAAKTSGINARVVSLDNILR